MLDRRHIWTQKNSAFSNIIPVTHGDEVSTKEFTQYKKSLVCKAIEFEQMLIYSQTQAEVLPEIAYEETLKFLRKHAPEQLEAVLSEFADTE